MDPHAIAFKSPGLAFRDKRWARAYHFPAALCRDRLCWAMRSTHFTTACYHRGPRDLRCFHIKVGHRLVRSAAVLSGRLGVRRELPPPSARESPALARWEPSRHTRVRLTCRAEPFTPDTPIRSEDNPGLTAYFSGIGTSRTKGIGWS